MAVPTVLQVPLPSGKVEKNYGIHSVRHSTAERIIFRITAQNRSLIQQAAKVLDMSEAQYVREIATNVAKVILKHVENHNAHPDDRSG